MNKKSEKKTDSDLDKQVSGIIDKITEGVEAKLSKKFSTKKPSKKIAGLMGKGSVKAKDVSKMNKEEKIYGFMQAVVQGDDEKSKMFYDDAREKALQEGVAAVGGNLVPNEFRAEIIREVREQYQMRNLVTVKKMKRLTMDIPKAVNRVKVYWTKEAAVKTTTTATFTQKQLIAYKLAAINILGGIRTLKSLIKNAVNCWDTPKGTISSEARLVMA